MEQLKKVMVDYVREMTVKKSCKYGEYGSFEQWLFLLIHIGNLYSSM